MIRVGVLPAIGNGLGHMQRQGQLARLFAHLEAYQGQCSYFSYAAEAEEQPLWDRRLGRLVAPPTAPTSPLRYGLTLAVRHMRAFQQCDVLRCTSLLGTIPAIVARLYYGTPFVFTYGADYLKIAQIHGRSRMHLRKWRVLRAVAMRLASAVIVQNRAMAVQLGQAYPKATIQCIPNWVDTDLFQPSGERHGDDRNVLYVGRLVKEKNLVPLAWACQELSLNLICVGTGPLEDQLRGGLIAKCVGAVPWEMLPQYHQAASIFVMPSHTEGHCKALIEAMASGLPCVVSKAVTEGMVPGVNCVQVDPTETGIALALEVLLTDREFAAKLGQAARETAVRLWSKPVILNRELWLLRDVAVGGV